MPTDQDAAAAFEAPRDGTSSAVPADLRAHSRAAVQIDEQIHQLALRPGRVLDAYRATNPEFGHPIPRIEDDLERYARRCPEIDRRVGQVADAFEHAGPGPQGGSSAVISSQPVVAAGAAITAALEEARRAAAAQTARPAGWSGSPLDTLSSAERAAEDFVTGFAAGVRDMAQAAMLLARVIPGTPMWMASMAVDPEGTVTLQEQFARGLAHMVEHPVDALGTMIDIRDLQAGDYAKWLGHLTPDVIVTVLTAGGGGAAAAAGEGVAKTAAETTAEQAATTALDSRGQLAGAAAGQTAAEVMDRAAEDSAQQAGRAAGMGEAAPRSASLPEALRAPADLTPTELYGRGGRANPVQYLPRVGSGLKVDLPGRGAGSREFAQTALAHGFPDIIDNYAGLAENRNLDERSGALSAAWIARRGRHHQRNSHTAMTPLEELEAAGIPVSWSTVRLGLEGPGASGPQLDLADVRSWLETSMDREVLPDGAVDTLIAIDGGAHPSEILSQLPPASTPWPPENELRKWQWLMLRRELRRLPPDPFYAALALADFWSQFDDEHDAPSPSRTELASRLTRSDRDRLVGRQKAWLATTHEALRRR